MREDQEGDFCSTCGMDLNENGSCAGCNKAPEACTCGQPAVDSDEEE